MLNIENGYTFSVSCVNQCIIGGRDETSLTLIIYIWHISIYNILWYKSINKTQYQVFEMETMSVIRSIKIKVV